MKPETLAQWREEAEEYSRYLVKMFDDHSGSLLEHQRRIIALCDEVERGAAREKELVTKIKHAIADLEYELHEDDESQALGTLAEALLIHQRITDDE